LAPISAVTWLMWQTAYEPGDTVGQRFVLDNA